MTNIDFFKNEPTLLKIIYIIGLILFGIHLINAINASFKGYELEHLFSIGAYSIMTIFFFRMSLKIKKIKGNK